MKPSTETVNLIGYGMMVCEWRCPFCHEPVEIIDASYYIWSCKGCGAIRLNGMDLRYYDPETGMEVEELRVEHSYEEGADARCSR